MDVSPNDTTRAPLQPPATSRRPVRQRARAVVVTADAHPVLVAFVVALVARIGASVVLEAFGSGLHFDDTTYSWMAMAKAAGETDTWDPYTHALYDGTKTFLVPLTFLYRVFGDHALVGPMLAAVGGSAAASLTAWTAGRFLRPRHALFAGLVVALMPSQVVFSSLTLKDSTVWACFAAIAALTCLSIRGEMRSRILAGLGIVLLLVALRYLRVHSIVIAAWGVTLAALFAGPRDRLTWGSALVWIGVVPALLGLGVGGIGFVRQGASGVEERRVAQAQGNTAIISTTTVPARATPSAEGEVVDEGPATTSNLRHAPRGVLVMLVEPLPWTRTDNQRVRFAMFENIAWYPLLALGALGLLALRRHRAFLLFPVAAGGATVLTYAIAEGNFGTAYRHRGELAWVVALLAAVGVAELKRRWCNRNEGTSPIGRSMRAEEST